MKHTNENYMFEEMPIPKAVASLAVPTIISSLVMVIYSMADTYFVGMLNAPVQTAAVTLAAPVLLAFNAVNNLFGIGSSSMMSRALGRKDHETIRHSSAFGFYGAIFCALMFSVFSLLFRSPLLQLLGTSEETMAATNAYLTWTVTVGAVPAILNVVVAYMIRSEGGALNASLGTMGGCLMNIVLDPIFILPQFLNMGAAGAGLATCISNTCALLYFMTYLWIKRGKTHVCISPKAFCLKKDIVLGVCAVGVPASIQNLLNVTGSTLLNNLASPYGPAALAAMGICTKINMVPMYVALGLSQGIMPLVSYNYASGNIKRIKNTLRFSMTISEGFLFLSSFVMFLGSSVIVQLFIENPETVAYGSSFLKAFCLAQPVLGFDFLCVGVFQAVGMGRESLIFAILRKIVFEIPFLVILNTLFPLYGLPYAQAGAELLMAVIAGIVLVRFLTKASVQAAVKAETKVDASVD